MKKLSFRHLLSSVSAGCVMLTLGCVMLIAGYPTHLNDSNLFLLASLAVILAGAVIIVTAVRRKSKY